MNQAEVTKLVSRLRIPILAKHRRLRNPEGPQGRVKKLRSIVTALLKYERIEVYHYDGDEARGYVERLISDAIRHGDTHKETMDMADFWIEEKNIVHKLFKVLVPRFQNTTVSYTRAYNAPIPHATPEKSDLSFHSVIELRGNPFPPLVQRAVDSRLHIQNVLLDEAKKEYRAQKYAEIAQDLESRANADSSAKSEELAQNNSQTPSETTTETETK
ncbi:39S ribosomal protein L17, mitochondrial [Diaphorina citri]|uniref:Large ribosomal subunit protein bL17m n=1 Tax=Diaphorina citri TaxID=121845 RepID=A0A1S3DVP7_DIACI|nr:39S ribosomal protein L17, mitochondrial [Diaphorina citri]